MTHVCRVDPKVPPAAPGTNRLPVSIGIYYAPDLRQRTDSSGDDVFHRWVVPIGAATVAAFNEIAPTLSADVRGATVPAPVASNGPDAILSIELRSFRMERAFFGHRATADYVAVLSGPAGEEVARVAATATTPPAQPFTLSACAAMGTAASAAIGEAAARIRTEIVTSPRVAAWAEGRARARLVQVAAQGAAAGPIEAAGTGDADRPPLPSPNPPEPGIHLRPSRFLPRYLGGGAGWGATSSSHPSIGGRSGGGWNVVAGWELSERLVWEFRAEATYVGVGATPDIAYPPDRAEHGVGATGPLFFIATSGSARPWVAVHGTYERYGWNTWAYSIDAVGLRASAGVDLAPSSIGAIRLGAAGGFFRGGSSEDAGASGTTLTFFADWIFDFGPYRW